MTTSCGNSASDAGKVYGIEGQGGGLGVDKFNICAKMLNVT